MLIQTLAKMTPGMILDLAVQEVLEDGSVLFSEGPVPGLVLRASKYHRAGECIPLVPLVVSGRDSLPVASSPGHRIPKLSYTG